MTQPTGEKPTPTESGAFPQVTRNGMDVLREIYTEEQLAAMSQERFEGHLWRLGYDKNGAKLQPRAEEVAKAYEMLQAQDEFTINVSAENTVNIGDYSSAKRQVFLSTKIKLPTGQSGEARLTALRVETRKLQLVAETQLTSIIADVMGPEGLNRFEIAQMFKAIFMGVLARTKTAFGIVPPPPAPAAPK